MTRVSSAHLRIVESSQLDDGAHSLRLDDLTPRQRQIAELLGLGLNRREIAEHLSREGSSRLSIRTVDVHLQAIAARLPKDDLPAGRRVRKWVKAHPRA